MKSVSDPNIDRQLIEEKLRRRTLRSDEGCWEWMGTRCNTGYGVIVHAGVRFTAHRAAYEIWVGKIPDGYHVHHWCRHRECVRPDHLQAMPASAHVQLAQPRGYVLPPHQARRETMEERFQAIREITPSGCWKPSGQLRKDGYRNFGFDGKRYLLHRASYLYYKGEIEEGYDVDHLCRTPYCFNPDHLEAVPRTVNILRGKLSALKAERTHCKRGHLLDEQNTYRQPYRRKDGTLCYTETCFTCQQDANRRTHERRTILHPRVLNPEMACQMREMRAKGALLREIAARFGICEGHACSVIKENSWKPDSKVGKRRS